MPSDDEFESDSNIEAAEVKDSEDSEDTDAAGENYPEIVDILGIDPPIMLNSNPAGMQCRYTAEQKDAICKYLKRGSLIQRTVARQACVTTDTLRAWMSDYTGRINKSATDDDNALPGILKYLPAILGHRDENHLNDFDTAVLAKVATEAISRWRGEMSKRSVTSPTTSTAGISAQLRDLVEALTNSPKLRSADKYDAFARSLGIAPPNIQGWDRKGNPILAYDERDKPVICGFFAERSTAPREAAQKIGVSDRTYSNWRSRPPECTRPFKRRRMNNGCHAEAGEPDVVPTRESQSHRLRRGQSDRHPESDAQVLDLKELLRLIDSPGSASGSAAQSDDRKKAKTILCWWADSRGLSACDVAKMPDSKVKRVGV